MPGSDEIKGLRATLDFHDREIERLRASAHKHGSQLQKQQAMVDGLHTRFDRLETRLERGVDRGREDRWRTISVMIALGAAAMSTATTILVTLVG